MMARERGVHALAKFAVQTALNAAIQRTGLTL